MVAFLAGGERGASRRRGEARRGPPPSRRRRSPPTPARRSSLPAALDARLHALGGARDRVRPDARQALLPAAGWRRSSAGFERVTGQDLPEAEAEQALLRDADLLRRQPRRAARRRRADVVAAATPSGSTSSWSWPSCWPSRWPTRRPRRRREAVGGWFVLNDWSRARRPGRGLAREHLRPGRQVEDVRQLDRRRRPHRRRGAGLDGGSAAGSGSTASSGARARPPAPPTTSARCWPTPRPASASSPAT